MSKEKSLCLADYTRLLLCYSLRKMKKLILSLFLISALVAGVVASFVPSAYAAGPYKPGCYADSSGKALTCPAGAVDTYGQPITPATYCYVPGNAPGLPPNTFKNVACADLTTPAATAGNNAPTCESTGISLSWLLCPVINGLTDAVTGMNRDIIKPLLQEKPIDLSTNPDPNANPLQIYKIWSNFRFFGDLVLVIALLVIVFSEVIGGGIIDAYTVRRALPRVLIAAILINLSIYIVAGLVDITNIVGGGVVALISSPFVAAGDYSLNLSNLTSALGLGTLAAGGVAIFALGGALVEFLLVFVLLPAVIAFVGALFTVVIRQGLIVFLLLTSPVAFALYAMPNTEQWFKKWWNLLFITLMVYPIVETIFALANVLAVTIDKTSTGLTNGIAQLVALAALVLPISLFRLRSKWLVGQ